MRFDRNAVPFALAGVVAVLLGCAAGDTRAQETTDNNKAGDEAKSDSEKKKEPDKHFDATVTDNYGTKPFLIHDAVIWLPETSLLGGESGQVKRSIVVKHGAEEVEVPLEAIEKISVEKLTDEGVLPVTVTFLDPKKYGDPITGTVKSSLQLRGKYHMSPLDATVKLRETKEIDLKEYKPQSNDPGSGK
jgi:hypothetical protein